MSAHISVFALITLWVSVQDGLCLLVIKPLDVRASDDLPVQRVRNKRCSCSTLIDSECFYFCHLDIIWVNTPSRTTVYGLGSYGLSRHRRSADRCTCADPDDNTCSRFCHHRAAASGSRRVLGAPESHRNKALKLREQMITKQCGH